MFDVQFTYSQGALCYQDTNSLWKLDLTKKGNNQAEMTRLILVDKVVTSNNVNVTSAHAQGFTNEVATNWGVFFFIYIPCVRVVLLFPWLIISHWVFTLPLPGHHHFLSTICLKTSAARMILRMIQCLVQSLKAELISRPSYLGVPAERHEAISGPWCPPTVPAALSLPHPSLSSGIYFPSPPCKVTPSEIFLHLPSLSLSHWSPPPMMDELHTLGCLSLSIMPRD